MIMSLFELIQRLRLRVVPLVSDTLQPTIEPPLPLQEPLSLQQTSILYVISNLEEFPPDMLALLPLRF